MILLKQLMPCLHPGNQCYLVKCKIAQSKWKFFALQYFQKTYHLGYSFPSSLAQYLSTHFQMLLLHLPFKFVITVNLRHIGVVCYMVRCPLGLKPPHWAGDNTYTILPSAIKPFTSVSVSSVEPSSTINHTKSFESLI